MTTAYILQILIVLFSGSAIWLVGRKETWRRWGYIMGLAGQPFWIYTTITTHQWGMLLLCFWYSYSWAQGVYNYWYKPWKDQRDFNREVARHIKDPHIVSHSIIEQIKQQQL